MSFEGEIGEIDLIERLVELGGEQFTGAIRFESDGIIKIVYFKGGDVLSASTNDRTDAIDEILQRAGKVTREHIKQALAKRKESETLGDALLGLGFITRKELTWARRVQVIGIIRSIIGWKTGSYTIVADYLPKREEGTLFSLAQIIVELVVTDNDRTKSEQAMDSGNAVFAKAANFDDAFRRLGLNEDAEQIVAQIDGRNSAAEVASRSGKDIFNVYKLLEALRLLKLVTRANKPPVEHEVSLPVSASPWDVENPDFTLDDDSPPPVADAPQEEDWGLSPEDVTMEIPEVNRAAWDAVQTTPATPSPIASKSVWDEPDEDDRFSGTELAPPPIAPIVGASALAAEPQWGFDEAQIEAARRAAVPVRGKDEVPSSIAPPASKPPRKSRAGLWITILVLLLLGGAAYPAWQWWQDRNAPEPIVPVKRAKLRNAGVPPAGPAASSPPTATATSTVPIPPLAGNSTAARTSPLAARTVTATTSPLAATTASSAQSPATTTTAQRSPSQIATKTAPPSQVAAKPAPPQKQPSPAKAAAVPPVLPRTRANEITPIPSPTSAATSPHLERSASGAPTISNTPATAAPVNDATRAKYDTMAKDFAAQKGGNYTVQFELVCETASITRALHDAGDKAWFVPISYRGRPCYRVFWGRFDTSAEAITASKSMPSGLSKAPVVVKIPR